MTEQILNAIKHEEEYRDFRKKWNQKKILDRENGFESAISSSEGKGWLEVTRLTAEPDKEEQDEEMRQEWVDYRLEQAEKRLCLTKSFSESRYVLACDAAVHEITAENQDENLYYFTAVYTHQSRGEFVPIGKSFTADSKETRKLALDLCQALKELHDADVLHKYIAPENVYKTEDGTYCLGRAGIEDDVAALKKRGLYPRETYDVQSDIFMLGQLLSRIHAPENLSAKAAKQLSEVINKACDPEPYRRYQSAQEMLDALQKRVNSKKLAMGIGIGAAAAAVIVAACLIVPSFLGRKLPEKSELQETQATEPAETLKETETQAPAETSAETNKETVLETQPSAEKPSTATPGDPNGDGIVDARDAANLLQLTAGDDFSGTEAHFDYNEDGEVDAKDVVEVLAYSAYASSGGTDSFSEFLAKKED